MSEIRTKLTPPTGINKSIVFTEVSKITGYTGKNLPTNEAENEKPFDLVAVTADEEDLRHRINVRTKPVRRTIPPMS